MAICNDCFTELITVDAHGNESCPKLCWLRNAVDPLSNEENENSGVQKAAESEDKLNGHLQPASVKQTHCWTSRGGIHCPGIVKRTLEVQDGPYGHFCPECGHSLRYHKYYGEGRPGDKARKGQVPS
jgi:hypothetical protein